MKLVAPGGGVSLCEFLAGAGQFGFKGRFVGQSQFVLLLHGQHWVAERV